jgi:copper chaperone CopZ
MPSSSIRAVAIRTETVQVSGIRCERCVARLGAALRGHDGIEAANANLMGEVTLSWDEQRTSREALVDALSKAGFRELDLPAGE